MQRALPAKPKTSIPTPTITLELERSSAVGTMRRDLSTFSLASSTSLVSSSCTLSKMLWTICTSLSVISGFSKSSFFSSADISAASLDFDDFDSFSSASAASAASASFSKVPKLGSSSPSLLSCALAASNSAQLAASRVTTTEPGCTSRQLTGFSFVEHSSKNCSAFSPMMDSKSPEKRSRSTGSSFSLKSGNFPLKLLFGRGKLPGVPASDGVGRCG
mmetsp:Transcript_37120/g.58651  ORF Transcript_37120/g.58651 Transcript_37120/m.58651 type:complete len:218 (-) Transcript_37120:1442-2095(-)